MDDEDKFVRAFAWSVVTLSFTLPIVIRLGWDLGGLVSGFIEFTVRGWLS